MKVVAQPIEVISYMDKKGALKPLRFRVQAEDHVMHVIIINKIIIKETEKIAGNPIA